MTVYHSTTGNTTPPTTYEIKIIVLCRFDETVDQWLATVRMDGVEYKETAEVRRVAINRCLDRMGL